jgi:hypothetical protein
MSLDFISVPAIACGIETAVSRARQLSKTFNFPGLRPDSMVPTFIFLISG